MNGVSTSRLRSMQCVWSRGPNVRTSPVFQWWEAATIGLKSRAVAVALLMISALALAPPVASADSWSPAASPMVSRAGATATLLPNGKVLVAGGYDDDALLSQNLSSAELYDPSSDSWSPVGDMQTARAGHTATLLGNGKVLVTGGLGNNPLGTLRLASAELYDPATNAWSSAGTMSSGRSDSSAVLLNDNRVLVAGGYGPEAPLSSADLYDPASNSWSQAAPLPVGTFGAAAALLSNGKVLVAGGQTAVGTRQAAQLYDPTADAWSPTSSMSVARGFPYTARLSDGKVLVAGGNGVTAELYDPASGTWSDAGSMAVSHSDGAMTALADGTALVAGGSDDDSTGVSGATELYDEHANTWSRGATMRSARSMNIATLLADGRVLVTGGPSGEVQRLAGYTHEVGAGAEVFDPDGASPVEAASVDLPAGGGTVHTNEDVSPSDPIGTIVATPSAGLVSIRERPEVQSSRPGFKVAGQEVLIEAPTATSAAPVRIRLLVDASLLKPGQDGLSIPVRRWEQPIPRCTGSGDTATPDPCVADRHALAGGDMQIDIVTSYYAPPDGPSDRDTPGTLLDTPFRTATYRLNSVVHASYACEDDDGPVRSGVATCTGTVPDGALVDTSTVGSHLFHVYTSDKAGNFNVKDVDYNVVNDTLTANRTIPWPSPAVLADPQADIGALATLGGRLFAFNYSEGSSRVHELDPLTGRVLTSISLGALGPQTYLASDGSTLFVSRDPGEGVAKAILRVDPDSQASSTVPITGIDDYFDIVGLGYAGGRLYLEGFRPDCYDSVIAIDPSNGHAGSCFSASPFGRDTRELVANSIDDNLLIAGFAGQTSEGGPFIVSKVTPGGELVEAHELTSSVVGLACIDGQLVTSDRQSSTFKFYDLPSCELPPTNGASTTAGAGQSVSTSLGASPADPTGTTVTTPIAGAVAITEVPVTESAPSGYAFAGQQVNVEAPTASPEQPLKLAFRIDASVLPAGTGADDLVVFRNGTAIAPCAGTSGQADPDPCVSLREALPDGDARITVLTSHASRWNFGTVQSAGPVITLNAPADGATYALKSVVRASYSCVAGSDGSKIASCKGTKASGSNIDTGKVGAHTFSVVAKDKAGRTATRTVQFTVVPDTIAPTIALESPEDGAQVTVKSIVRASFACHDEAGGSGLASCNGSKANGSALDTRKVGAHSFSVIAKDKAGNTKSKTVHYTVVADTEPPTVSLESPADGAQYRLKSVVRARFSCEDGAGGSGIASCKGTQPNGAMISTSKLGPGTFRVVAKDAAGNTTTKTSHYMVTAP